MVSNLEPNNPGRGAADARAVSNSLEQAIAVKKANSINSPLLKQKKHLKTHRKYWE